MNARTQAVARRVVPGVVAVGLVLVAWQGLTSSGVISRTQFPTMSDTARTLGEEFVSPEFWGAVGFTLFGWAVGLLIGSALAIIVGTLLGLNDRAYRSVAPVIEIFKAIPAVAILPLVIMVLGSTQGMKIFLISFAVFWQFVIQAVYGMRSIDPVTLDTARALGVKGVRKFGVVILPSAAPFLATGLRIGSGAALIIAVVAELIGGAEGLGRTVLRAQNAGPLEYPTMYAYIVVAGLLGVLLTGLILLLERRLLHWHESQRRSRENEMA